MGIANTSFGLPRQRSAPAYPTCSVADKCNSSNVTCLRAPKPASRLFDNDGIQKSCAARQNAGIVPLMFRLGKAFEHSLVLKIAISVLLMAPTLLLSQTISGTVQDSSGAVIANARIEISAADFPQPLVLSSNALGQFESPQLKPGTYSVRVTRDGFEPLVKTVELQNSMQLQLTLEVAQQQVTISVPG